MKLERAYTNSLTTQLKVLEPKEANTAKRSRQQEITKLRAENKKIETKWKIWIKKRTIFKHISGANVQRGSDKKSKHSHNP